MTLNESHVENATLEWLSELDYTIGHGPHITSLRTEIAKGQNLDRFDLKVTYSRKVGRKNGWTRLKSTDRDVLGGVNVRWDSAVSLLMCVVTTRGDAMPSALISSFLHYLLANYDHEISSVNIVPRD